MTTPTSVIEEDGSTFSRWEIDGELSRDDGPAFTEHVGGKLRTEQWYLYGGLHRLDGPASTAYHPNGAIAHVEFYVNDEPVRADGPAAASFSPTGEVEEEWFFSPGRNYRIDGPTRIAYGSDGAREEQYEFEGRTFPTFPALARHVLDQNYRESSLRGEMEDSIYAPLLDEGATARRIYEILAAGVTSVNGIRQVLGGAPTEWARAFEEGQVVPS